MQSIKKVFMTVVTTASILPYVAFAQGGVSGAYLGQGQGPQNVNDIFLLLGRIFGYVRTLFFIVAAFFVLYAAYLYLTAAGDPEKVGAAKNQLIYAAIAIAVALIATSVEPIVRSILG